MITKYQGRRFFGFLLTSACLTFGSQFVPIESYAVFAQTIGLAFAVYVGGQSATDWKNGTHSKP